MALFEFGLSPLDTDEETRNTSNITLSCQSNYFTFACVFYANSIWPSSPFTKHQSIGTAPVSQYRFQYNTWYHMMMAVDTSPSSTVNSTPTTILSAVNIGFPVNPKPTLPPVHNPVQLGDQFWVPTYGPADGDGILYEIQNVTDSGTHNLLISGKKIIVVMNGSHVALTPDRTGPIDQFEGSPDTSFNGFDPMPGYSMAMTSAECGIPCIASNLTGIAKKFDAAQWQIYFGTFIDPTITANFTKFIKLTTVGSVTTGTPAATSLATNAFGTPSVLMTGDKSHFPTNLGTAGSFVKTGTISDFTPGPSYT